MGGSIPLPALDIRGQQPQQDLTGNLANILALRNQMQEQPLRQQILAQQQQSGALQVQQQQQAMQDQQAFRSAMQDPSLQGKTIGDVADALAKKGALSPSGYFNLKKADLDQRQALASLDKDQLANAAQAHAQTQQLYDNVMNMPDDQLAQNWPQIAQQYDAIPGNNKQPLDPSRPLTKQQLQQFGPMLSMQESYLKDAQAKQKSQVDLQTAQADLLQKQQNLIYGPSGPAAEAKYRFILQKKASGLPLSPDETSFARGYEASQAKSTTQSDSLGVVSNNLSRPAGLAAVSGRTGAVGPSAPGGKNSPTNLKNDTVDMIGQYRMDPNTVGRMLYRHPEMLGLIQARYPDWDQTAYQAKNKIVQSYTSGPESRSINAIGTALGHANELRDAIDALGNGDAGIKALRDIGNKMGVQVGNDKITAFNTIVHRLAPEITAAYVQGGGGEGERAAAADDFSPALSRQQLLSNWSETVKLLQSKIAQQQQQWDTTFQPKDAANQFANRFLSQPAKAAIQRWSGETGNQSALESGSLSVTAPNGKTYTFKDQGSLAAFKKAAGIQ